MATPAFMIRDTLAALLRLEKIIIVTHMRPDGDALGSQLALGLFLRKLGKSVMMINSDPAPRNLEWLISGQRLLVFNGSLEQRKSIAAADAIVMVDNNSLERVGDLARLIQQCPGQKILIDHHPDPEPWFDTMLSVSSASSTGELIYQLIQAHNPDMIDREISVLLYTAIMTDTGSFQYNSMTPDVHRIVADLLERGDINPEPIHIAVFHTRSLSGLKLLGMALETISLACEDQLGYMVVTQDMLHETSAATDDTEGFISYLLSLEKVVVGVLFLETDRGIKMSFRSKGEIAINGWARHFGGGGHRNASGAFVKKPLHDVIADVINVAPRYLPFATEGEDDQVMLSPEDAALLTAFKKI